MKKRETHEWYMSKNGFLCHHCGATATRETMAEVNQQDCIWPNQSLEQVVAAELPSRNLPQYQGSLTEQLKILRGFAVKLGLYDADDFLQRHIASEIVYK